MVGSTLIDLFNSVYIPVSIGCEDFGDRLSFFTVVLLLASCIIVSTKTYVFNAVSCYVSVSPSGNGFDGFLTDYCWVHGTIPLYDGEVVPSTDEEWSRYDMYRRINYYQWVPFVLGLQCILFYLPHMIWQMLCSKRAGGDVFELIKTASHAAMLDRKSRDDQVKRVAEFLEDMIDEHRPIRRGRRARLVQRAANNCGGCVVSKRMGTCLMFAYLGVKLLMIVNAFIQLFLIQRFLGFHDDGTSGWKSHELRNAHGTDVVTRTPPTNSGAFFGWTLLQHITSGNDWPETLIFPRVAYCRVPGIRLVGVDNAYTAQCALPINMLNEKLYIFLWFWIMMIIIGTIISLFVWLYRLVMGSQRKDFIKRYLRSKGFKSPTDAERDISRAEVDAFVDEYLRRDGLFILRMLSQNAGEVVTSEIVAKLYSNYLENFGEATKSDSPGSIDKQPLGFTNPRSYV